MRLIERVRVIVFSWDWVAAILVTLVTALFIPSNLSYEIANQIFSAAMEVLAIIFSVFFAALAVLITAGDNEFVRFLAEDGSYNKIIWTFKFTLFLLFVALVAAIILFIVTLPLVESDPPVKFPRNYVFAFAFFALYALFAAINASADAIKYAEYRARYLEITNKDRK